MYRTFQASRLFLHAGVDARLVISAALLTDNGYTSSLLRYQGIMIQLIRPQADATALTELMRLP